MEGSQPPPIPKRTRTEAGGKEKTAAAWSPVPDVTRLRAPPPHRGQQQWSEDRGRAGAGRSPGEAGPRWGIGRAAAQLGDDPIDFCVRVGF